MIIQSFSELGLKTVKGTMSRELCLQFFFIESSFPQPLIIILLPFLIFPKLVNIFATCHTEVNRKMFKQKFFVFCWVPGYTLRLIFVIQYVQIQCPKL